ncbi:MAG TPA: hypothetical protein VJU59_14425 [Paraburkholderia sp.]|uniref:hypothetical protein n=1 Tax=Paraburkholderia sp. TaxID=1926495 RepID=UPI002B492E78|nr:hypothetical protein [Paraburkholderia sp.]HKR40851.1 hypothetical protein [Paraburkholderia sp.]
MTEQTLAHLDPDHLQGQLLGLVATLQAIAEFLPRDAFINEFKARIQAQRNALGFHDHSNLRLNALNDYENSLLYELS